MTSPSAQPPCIFDRERLAARRDRAAATFNDYAFLKDRVSRALVERLTDTPRIFEQGLDLGAHDGRAAAAILQSGRCKSMQAADLSPAMVKACQAKGIKARQADAEALPFQPRSFELIVSAVSLHWVNDLPGALVQIRQSLKPDGLFLAALLGAGTLSELRSVLMAAETELTGGVSPRLSPLPGLKDMAGLLQRTGFALPVADRETVTVNYAKPERLFDDLKGMAERACFMPGMTRPLRSDVLKRALQLYRETYETTAGKIPATFEIIWLSGWAPDASQPKPLKPGSATISLADAIKTADNADD